MKNTEPDPSIGVSFPILYVRRSVRLNNKMRQDDGSSDDTIDLTNDHDNDFEEEIMDAEQEDGTRECNGKLKKRKKPDIGSSMRRRSLRNVHCQSVVKVKNVKRKRHTKTVANPGIVKYFGVTVKQCGDDATEKNSNGKRRLVLAEEKDKRNGLVDKNLVNDRKKYLVGHKRKAKKSMAETEKSLNGDVVIEKKKKVAGRKKNGKNGVVDNEKVPADTGDDAPVGAKHAVDRIHLRVSWRSLHQLLLNLTPKQKEDVTAMGFGAVLDFKLSEVLTRLSYLLLDNFDEKARVLKFNGKCIQITREAVKDILGLPMGDQVLETPDEADYRDARVIGWKAQFGRKLRYLHGPLEELMYTQPDGGWMFKKNFLVLFVTTLVESNMNATCNLRFLKCIADENDIQKFDWCTYVIDCLVKTKKNWVRSSHYPGPIIILLILYAHYAKPNAEDEGSDGLLVNNWTNDMLNQLEEKTIRLEELKKNMREKYKMAAEFIDEGDVMLDDAIADNPLDVDLQDIKDFRDCLFGARSSSELKKGDAEVVDDDNATVCEEKPVCPETRSSAGVGFRTPKSSKEPFRYTPVYGTPSAYVAFADEVELRLSKQKSRKPETFDDMPSFDLNITQEFEATRRSTELAKPDDHIGGTQELLESLKFYDSQKQVNEHDYQTPVLNRQAPADGQKDVYSAISIYNICDATPIRTLLPKVVDARPKRNIRPSIGMCSPYTRRAVSLTTDPTINEQRAADCLFSARREETDMVFNTAYAYAPRGILETLCPEILIASGVIDVFTKVLNHAEQYRNPLKSMKKVFCDTTMVNDWDVVATDGQKKDVNESRNRFINNMQAILRTTIYKNLNTAELVFFPVIQQKHFFVVCMHMSRKEVHVLDNVYSTSNDVRDRYGDVVDLLVARFEDFLGHTNHPSHGQFMNAPRMILRLGCRTLENIVDCGVFTMRHMETYLGGGEYDDLCDLKREKSGQKSQLNELRTKYAAKILLSEINQAKQAFEEEADAYKRLSLKERQQLKDAAYKNILKRSARML